MVKKRLYPLIAVVFWLGIWEVAALAVSREVLLPSPVATVKCLFSLAGHIPFWETVFYSVLRIIAGFAAGVAAGALLASLSYRFGIVKALFSPLLLTVKSTPVASFIILALVWIGRGSVPSFISFLMVVPIMYNSVLCALEGVSRELREVTHVFGFTLLQKLKTLYFPSVFPQFLSGCNVSLGLAWKAGIAAEVLSTPPDSIGKMIYDSKIYLESTSLFAWTLTVILLSLLLEKSISAIAKHFGSGNGVRI